MTLRHKLADWISGGELTREKSQAQAVLDAMLRLNDLDNAKAKALRQIERIGHDTGGHDASRMAAIAREALE